MSPEMYEKALSVTFDNLRGQVNQDGEPEILFPILLQSKLKTQQQRVIALLHYLTDKSLGTGAGIWKELGEEVFHTLTLLAKDPHISYGLYLQRLCFDNDARAIMEAKTHLQIREWHKKSRLNGSAADGLDRALFLMEVERYIEKWDAADEATQFLPDFKEEGLA